MDKFYTIVLCNKYFKFWEWYRIVELTDDACYIDIQYEYDITKLPNREIIDCDSFETIEEAKKMLEVLSRN